MTVDALRRAQRLRDWHNLDKKNFISRLACLSPLWEVRSENELLGFTDLLFYFFQIRVVTLKARAFVLFGVLSLAYVGAMRRLLLIF